MKSEPCHEFEFFAWCEEDVIGVIDIGVEYVVDADNDVEVSEYIEELYTGEGVDIHGCFGGGVIVDAP